MSDTREAAIRELRKAGTCLHIAVEPHVVEDVQRKIEAVIGELEEAETEIVRLHAAGRAVSKTQPRKATELWSGTAADLLAEWEASNEYALTQRVAALEAEIARLREALEALTSTWEGCTDTAIYYPRGNARNALQAAYAAPGCGHPDCSRAAALGAAPPAPQEPEK